MSYNRSDNESDTEVFVDAEEALDNGNSTSTTIVSSDNTNRLESNTSKNDSKNDNVQPEPVPSNKPSAIAVPQISVTDMSFEDEEQSGSTKDQTENGHVSLPEIDSDVTDNDEPAEVTVYIKDLDTGKNIPASDLEEEINKSNGNIDPLSFHIMQRTGSDTELNHIGDETHTRSISDDENNSTEDKSNRRKSFLSRLKRTSHSNKNNDKDNDEGGDDGVTGNTAPVFSENTNGFGRAQPRYIKTRARNKPIKEAEFDRLFLAQELYNPISSDDAGVTNIKNGAIWCMKFSKDGKFLATGGQDTVVRVWAVISSDEEREHFLEGSGTSVYEGISGAKLGAPVFRDKPLYDYRGHTADVLDLSWSKNNFLLSSSMDKTVRLWHMTRKECLCCFQHTDFVTAIEFHPKDDRFFLSGSLDCRLRLWNIPEKKIASWNELPDSQLITAVGFTLDGKIAVAGSLSGLCLFYETDGLKYNTQIHVKSARGRNSQGKKITGIESMPGTLPGQDKLLISSNDSRIRLYNMRDKSLEYKYKGLENTCSQIRATFSDDGRYIISGSEDRHVYIFNTDQSRINSHHGGGSNWLKKEKCGYESFESHAAIVTVAVFAPTRTKQLISLCGDPIFTHTVNNETSSNQTYPDGNIIVCADYTGIIKIFRQDCAYYPSHDSDSVSFRSTRSWNSSLGSNLNQFFAKKPKSHESGISGRRRKSDASSIYSVSSNLSADISVNGDKENGQQFQCACGSTDFKAFVKDGTPKLVCASCNKTT
ncbi:WD40-repeat-containing domain protein [Gigaspora rosea]|uniref:WD40-repeat-containing domain protein n=1 Tax=Gigaspora rosea TaxID=44941 RepID=A0A397U1N8_9GLOM|nr:WD40-repeat-containing domain protein [Gigaspora rosea]